MNRFCMLFNFGCDSLVMMFCLRGKNVALQVMVKMKSRHVAGTITKKKKSKQAAAKQPRMA